MLYMYETGILLDKNDPESHAYDCVYDKKYGYYDEAQGYSRNLDTLKRCLKKYVKKAVPNTYAVISMSSRNIDPEKCINDVDVEGETYDVESIVYSITKDANGNLVENFIS